MGTGANFKHIREESAKSCILPDQHTGSRITVLGDGVKVEYDEEVHVKIKLQGCKLTECFKDVPSMTAADKVWPKLLPTLAQIDQ